MDVVEQILDELRNTINCIETGHISEDCSPEMIAQATAIVEHQRTHPVSDEDAMAAGAAFICFTPLGGN
jgi:hypothetical protein